MNRTKLSERLKTLENQLKPEPMPTFVVDVIRHRDQIEKPHLFEVDTEKHDPPGNGRCVGVTIREFKRIEQCQK